MVADYRLNKRIQR